MCHLVDGVGLQCCAISAVDVCVNSPHGDEIEIGVCPCASVAMCHNVIV